MDKPVLLQDKTPDGVSIKIGVHTAEYNSSVPYKSGFRWGAELKEPRIIVTRINVEFGNTKVFVPLSAYCDLTNPNICTLQTSNKSFVLVIEGGQASTSYKAEIYFENGYIKKRKVSHQEFPDESWEETVYSFNYLF
ncbi:MAG: hypothetical protein SWH61_17845 [Thermodesulfobacteriota bacterium]|nr:hypothetical protein [Thermodesulfobacteriota bacterium]